MTVRQQLLLAAIIKEFIETASAVGSINLSEKYKFNVSPATIRNEMAALVQEGYLEKPHSSSGRIPTEKGLKFFIENTLAETQSSQQLGWDKLGVDVITQESIKSQLHNIRFDMETLVRRALKFLVQRSHNAAVSLIDKSIFYSGLSDMLDIPEFQELDNLKTLMMVLEDYAKLSSIFNRGRADEDVNVLIGSETGLDEFLNYAVVFSELRLHGGRHGYIAVVGPNRMDYAQIIPTVGFVARTLNRLAAGW